MQEPLFPMSVRPYCSTDLTTALQRSLTVFLQHKYLSDVINHRQIFSLNLTYWSNSKLSKFLHRFYLLIRKETKTEASVLGDGSRIKMSTQPDGTHGVLKDTWYFHCEKQGFLPKKDLGNLAWHFIIHYHEAYCLFISLPETFSGKFCRRDMCFCVHWESTCLPFWNYVNTNHCVPCFHLRLSRLSPQTSIQLSRELFPRYSHIPGNLHFGLISAFSFILSYFNLSKTYYMS